MLLYYWDTKNCIRLQLYTVSDTISSVISRFVTATKSKQPLIYSRPWTTTWRSRIYCDCRCCSPLRCLL